MWAINSRNAFKMVELIIIVFCIISQITSSSSKTNPIEKEFMSGHLSGRQRRQLFSNGTNIWKSACGVTIPVDISDLGNSSTLKMGYYFHSQYMLIPPDNYSWRKYERSLHNQKKYSSNETVDLSRLALYNAVEIVMFRKGINGKECLQRAICENAQSPIKVTSIFHEILNLILSPNSINVNNADRSYIDAKNSGATGLDCLKIYKNCPIGQGLFDSIFQFWN